MEYQHFLNIFIKVLKKDAPMKQKYLRPNQGRFKMKNLHKVIMKRSRLTDTFLSHRTDINFAIFSQVRLKLKLLQN